MIIGYKSDEIVKITGITYRQLDYWTSKGLTTPEINIGGSSGKDRLYSLKNIFDISIIKYLKRYNLAFEDINNILSSLKFLPFPHDGIDSDILVINNRTIIFLNKVALNMPSEVKEILGMSKEFIKSKQIKDFKYLTPERIAKMKVPMIVIPNKKITKEILKAHKKLYKLESRDKENQIKALELNAKKWIIEEIREKIAELIGKATHKISMTSSNLDSTFWDNGEVIEALMQAKEKGVKVEIAFSGKIDPKSTSLRKLVKEEKVILYHTKKGTENHFMTVDSNYLYFEKPHLPGSDIRDAICVQNRRLSKLLEEDFANMIKQSKKVEMNSPLLN